MSRLSQGERLAAKRAWNYYEQVESYDAAVRVRLGNTGGALPSVPPGLWYQFNGEGQRALYEKGRRYHILICPTYNWIPQRNRPFPVTALTTVLPDDCPCDGDTCSGDTVPILRNIPQPTPEAGPVPRSAQLIREGLSPPEPAYNTITLVENTPSTPRSAATPNSISSPQTPGTPQSVKESAPLLEVTDLNLQTDTPPPEPAPEMNSGETLPPEPEPAPEMNSGETLPPEPEPAPEMNSGETLPPEPADTIHLVA